MLLRLGIAFALMAVPTVSAISPSLQDQSTFRDPRDGQVYPVIEIAGMKWFAQNLNFASADSFCYAENPKYCADYGRLYRWEAALSACPTGWHLSTESEWQALERSLGMSAEAIGGERNRGTDQGKRLKKGGATGFDNVYGGWRRSEDGGFEALDKNAAYWTSTESNLLRAWHRDIDTGDDFIFRSPVIKPYGLSVRCVKNRSDGDESNREPPRNSGSLASHRHNR